MLTCVYEEIGVKMRDKGILRGFRNYVAIPAALAASLYACGGDGDNITGDVAGDGGNNGGVKPIEKFSDGVEGQLILVEKDGKQTLELILNKAHAESGTSEVPPIQTSVIDEGHKHDYTKDGKVNKDDISIFLSKKPTSGEAIDFTKAFGYWERDGLDGRLDSGMNAKGEVYVRLPLEYNRLTGITNIAAEIKNSGKKLSFAPADVVNAADGPTLRFVDDALMGQETDVEYSARNDGRWIVRGSADGRVANVLYPLKKLESNRKVEFPLTEIPDELFIYVEVDKSEDKTLRYVFANSGPILGSGRPSNIYEDDNVFVDRQGYKRDELMNSFGNPVGTRTINFKFSTNNNDRVLGVAVSLDGNLKYIPTQ